MQEQCGQGLCSITQSAAPAPHLVAGAMYSSKGHSAGVGGPLPAGGPGAGQLLAGIVGAQKHLPPAARRHTGALLPRLLPRLPLLRQVAPGRRELRRKQLRPQPVVSAHCMPQRSAAGGQSRHLARLQVLAHCRKGIRLQGIQRGRHAIGCGGGSAWAVVGGSCCGWRCRSPDLHPSAQMRRRRPGRPVRAPQMSSGGWGLSRRAETSAIVSAECEGRWNALACPVDAGKCPVQVSAPQP